MDNRKLLSKLSAGGSSSSAKNAGTWVNGKGPSSKLVKQDQKQPKKHDENRKQKSTPTMKMTKPVLHQVLKEPAYRGKHTFASAVRLQRLFQLRDEKEREEVEKLIILPPTKDPSQEEKIAIEKAEALNKKLEEIRLAARKANEATRKAALANRQKANRVKQEKKDLSLETAVKKRLEMEYAKKLASSVKQCKESVVLNSQSCKQTKKEEAQDLKKRTNDLLTEAKKKIENERKAIRERKRMEKLQAMFKNRPAGLIKNPFEIKGSQVSEAETQVRLEVIRRQNENQLGLLRAKIKNEREEKAAKFKRALEEIELRTGNMYHRKY